MSDELKLFLDALYPAPLPDGITILVRGLPLDGTAPWSEFFSSVDRLLDARAELDRWNADGRSIFFGVALRDGRRGDKDHCWALPALWADLDAKDYLLHNGDALLIEWGKKLIDENVQTFQPQPSIIIDSGGGKQLYWLMQDLVCRKSRKTDVEWTRFVAEVEGTLRGMQPVLKSDPSRTNFDSLMRLPTFFNPKYPHRPVARVEVCDATRRYES